MNENPNTNKSFVLPWYRKWWGMVIIGAAFLIVILMVVLAVLFFKIINAPSISGDITTILTTDTLIKSEKRIVVERLDRPKLGNTSSGLVIVEFGDFRCPACKKEFPIIREVVNQHLDDVLYIYRSYPVIDDTSFILAEAALCANEQGKFWQMHDRLFIESDTLDDISNLDVVATKAGLDVNRFRQCITSEKYSPVVSEDKQLASDLGLLGTPTFFINGQKVQGVITKGQWEALIDKYKTLVK